MINESREPSGSIGFVGIFFAILLVAGIWGLSQVYSASTGSSSEISVKKQLVEQDEALITISRNLDRKKELLAESEALRATATEVENVTNSIKAENKKTTALEEQKTAIEDEIGAVQLTFEDYRDQYRKSERLFAEREIIDLSETKGPDFAACEILGISAMHLRIMRPTGPIGIPYQELPKAVQDRFQFAEDEAAVYERALIASDAARAKQFETWKSNQANKVPGTSSPELNRRLAETEKLALERHADSERLKAESDDWYAKGARYWKKIGVAKTTSGQKSAEATALKADAKADQLLAFSKAAKAEANRLDGEALEIKDLISKGAKK